MPGLKFILTFNLCLILFHSLSGQPLPGLQHTFNAIVTEMRSENNLQEMKYDTSLTKALQELNKLDSFKNNAITEDGIRTILQQNSCYDYHFTVLKMDLPVQKELSRQTVTNNQALVKVIKNNDFNTYCILTDDHGKMLFLATMRYIYFNKMPKNKSYVMTDGPGCVQRKEGYIYKINTNDDEIYFNQFKYIFNPDSHINNLTFSNKNKVSFVQNENGDIIYPYKATIILIPKYKSCVIYNKDRKILTLIPLYMIKGDEE